jgi:hypothetical protein
VFPQVHFRRIPTWNETLVNIGLEELKTTPDECQLLLANTFDTVIRYWLRHLLLFEVAKLDLL